MEKHFVTFYSPGTFVPEQTAREIDAWSVDLAKMMAATVLERHNATPFGFRFSTRSRGDDDLDSKVSASSPMYWLGGKIETLEEVEARNDPREEILRSNMRCNKVGRIITNCNSWKHTAALDDDAVVLDWTAPTRTGEGGERGE